MTMTMEPPTAPTTDDTVEEFTRAELLEAAAMARRYFRWIADKAIEAAGEFRPGVTETIRNAAKLLARDYNADLGAACLLLKYKSKFSATTLPATDPGPAEIRELEKAAESAREIRAAARKVESEWVRDRGRHRSEAVRSGDDARAYDAETIAGKTTRREAATAAEQESDRRELALNFAKELPGVRDTVLKFPHVAAAVGITIEQPARGRKPAK